MLFAAEQADAARRKEFHAPFVSDFTEKGKAAASKEAKNRPRKTDAVRHAVCSGESARCPSSTARGIHLIFKNVLRFGRDGTA